MKKKKELDVIFIIDKSGSMSGSEDNTISSFNEYLERKKKNKYDTYISTILFNDKYEYLHDKVLINDVNKLTREDYQVGGCTALYDAIGNAINNVDKKKTDKVMFIIITDGYENASREYSNNKIKKMIKSHSDWEFIFIGADIDSYSVGDSIGIKRKNIANYKKDKCGTSILFESVSRFGDAMMEDRVCENWKDKLDSYINENDD